VTTFAGASHAAGSGVVSDADLSALLRIRHFERALLDCFDRGLVNGTTHTCLGQEYVPVALEGVLLPDDWVFSNHRGHGHYLARFADPASLLAEIMGREGGVCGGYGGSQHLLRDRFMSTGVQGESLAVATGVARHLRDAEPHSLACVYIGDGTWGEGVVYEALNITALWRLPLVVVVENNGIAQSTPTSTAMAGTIAGRAAAFGVPHRLLGDTDLPSLRAILAPVVARVRAGHGPVVVEFTPPRLGPHSKGDDTRQRGEIEALSERDWARAYRSADPEQYARVDAEQAAAIAAVIRDVTARPLAGVRDVRP
jgi:TPP-dependent pyruvate/acetoin dehydrogenase alpha subunit